MLAYKVPGFTYPIERMDPDDREWNVNRLANRLVATHRAPHMAVARLS